MKKFGSPEEYIENHPEWQEALMVLRGILNEMEFEETIKWGAPVYTINGKNVVGIAAFKSYVGLWFYQGSLLQDKDRVLINAQKGVTKGLRQWRFNSIDEMDVQLIKVYLHEAIVNEKSGKRIKPERKPLIIPDELQQLLNDSELLNKSFEQLSLSKKREFADFISSAKRVETKKSRIEKIIPLIANGVGLNDKYR